MADQNVNNEAAAVQQPGVPAAPEAIDARAQREFMRGIPRYNLNERFDLHLERMNVLSGLYAGLGTAFLKQALYASLQNEAFKLVAPEMSPLNPPYSNDTFQAYCDRLSEVFEPSAEREAAKIEFEHRAQLRGEHPTLFYRDKLNLFLKGYSRETRDYQYFYHRVIANLLNAEMRNYLRLNIPQDLTDTNTFRASIIRIANVVRRKFLDGELSEEQAVGAECFSTNNSYLDSDSGPTVSQIRSNSINAIPDRKAQLGPCFYCKQYGHLKAQCPRKANGLPPTMINQVDQEVQQDSVEALYANKVHTKRFQPVRPFNRGVQNNKQQFVQNNRQPYKNKRFGKRRVMFVFEGEDGGLYCEPLDDHQDVDEPNVEQTTDKVEAVAHDIEQEGEVDSDYLPSSFLGLGM